MSDKALLRSKCSLPVMAALQAIQLSWENLVNPFWTWGQVCEESGIKRNCLFTFLMWNIYDGNTLQNMENTPFTENWQFLHHRGGGSIYVFCTSNFCIWNCCENVSFTALEEKLPLETGCCTRFGAVRLSAKGAAVWKFGSTDRVVFQ